MDNGWTHPNPIQATKEVIGPMTGGLLSMIVLPGAVFWCWQNLVPSTDVDDKFICKFSYADSRRSPPLNR